MSRQSRSSQDDEYGRSERPETVPLTHFSLSHCSTRSPRSITFYSISAAIISPIFICHSICPSLFCYLTQQHANGRRRHRSPARQHLERRLGGDHALATHGCPRCTYLALGPWLTFALTSAFTGPAAMCTDEHNIVSSRATLSARSTRARLQQRCHIRADASAFKDRR